MIRLRAPFVALFLSYVAAILPGCAPGPSYPTLDTVRSVDLERYAGLWYEIARIPKTEEDGCVGTTFQYTPVGPDIIKVIKLCHEARLDGPVRQIDGTAHVVEPETNAKMKVWFNFYGSVDTWILELDPAYRHVLVGAPDRESLWVLSRTPMLEPAVYGRLLDVAKQKGFDVSRLRKTDQLTQLRPGTEDGRTSRGASARSPRAG